MIISCQIMILSCCWRSVSSCYIYKSKHEW